MSPYSGKYVGYGIEKGKLLMKVHYLIDERRLTAENSVILDQLTFGGKVESPRGALTGKRTPSVKCSQAPGFS